MDYYNANIDKTFELFLIVNRFEVHAYNVRFQKFSYAIKFITDRWRCTVIASA